MDLQEGAERIGDVEGPAELMLRFAFVTAGAVWLWRHAVVRLGSVGKELCLRDVVISHAVSAAIVLLLYAAHYMSDGRLFPGATVWREFIELAVAILFLAAFVGAFRADRLARSATLNR